MSSRQFSLFALVLLARALAGCGGGGGGDSTGTLNVKITDAPFPVDCIEAAIIRVVSVEARGASGWVNVPLAAPAPDPDDPDAPEPVAPEWVDIDLHKLVAGLSESLALAELPTGAYDEIRLVIDGAQLVFIDPDPTDQEPAAVQDFKAPSGESSGIKIKINPAVVIAAGQTTNLMLDVNLTESFHVTGQGGEPTCDDLLGAKVIFRPVIRAINVAETALVLGVVTNDDSAPVGGVEVSAFLAGTVVTTETPPPASALTFSALDGMDAPHGAYALALEPGTYDLYVRLADTDPRTIALPGLLVVAGEILVGQDLTVPAGP